MKRLILTALTASALLFSSLPASAMSPKPGQACIMWICWDKPNQWKPNYGGRASVETIEPESTIARRGRSSTCSSNPYGRRSAYCNESEVEAPLETTLASTEFGKCLLDDTPIVLEELVDCRSDACLGRKFYYGSFGKVGR